MRRALVLTLAALALPGCGYGEDEPGAASPRQAFDRFVAAVVEGEADASDLVSRELDEDARESFVRATRSDLEPWGRDYRIIFDEPVDDGLAVVAAQADEHPLPGAHAFVLTRHGDAWLVQPNGVGLVYGPSAVRGTAAANPDVDFQVDVAGQHARPEGRLWLDRREVRLRRSPDSVLYTFRADLRRVERRVWSAVAFARIDDRVGAIAWTFRAR